MGQKYYVEAKLSGSCTTSQAYKSTNHFIVAVFTVIKYRLKYPIVDLAIRNGYEECDKCVWNGTGKLLCNSNLHSK